MGAPLENLPQGWATCTLDQLIPLDGVFTDGDWVETKDQDPNGAVRLIQLADVGDSHFVDKSQRFLTKQKARELNCTFLEKGDLLIARMPDPLGRACLFPLDGSEKFVTVVDVCVVRVRGSSAHPEFLMHVTNSPAIRAQIESYQSGSTRKRISRKNLARVRLPFPPLNEQRRIVAKLEELLSELDNAFENLNTARKKLKIYRQAVLKHAFEGKLTARWREENKDRLESVEQLLTRLKNEREVRYQQQLQEWKTAVKNWEENVQKGSKPAKPTPYNESRPIEPDELANLPGIPDGWNYVRLADVAQIGSGMSVSESRTLVDPIQVPYLRVANVQRGRLNLDEITTMKIERSQLPRLELKHWDVLFNEGGDRDKLGRGWVWESQIQPCITQNHVFRASMYIPSESHAKFLSYWGNVFGQAYFDREGKQTTNLASINKTVLSAFPVPLPSFEEQAKILSELDTQITIIDKLELEIATALNRLEILRQSILKEAFSGQLVPQDPNDEPASVLLERIKVENANQIEGNKKTRRKDAA